MQALMLAAGMGRRLGKYTEDKTKCMVKVGEKTLLERAIAAVREAGISKLVMVVGYEADKLVDFIKDNFKDIEFEFIYNYEYASTNNIYSLWLAREQLMQDDTILLESDIVYEQSLLRKLVDAPEGNLVVVAPYEQWMDGTVVTLDETGNVLDFIPKKKFSFCDADKYYKTVNIYKFSREFSKEHYLPFLEAYINAYGKNQYYETVLSVVAHISNIKLPSYVLNNVPWYEIDDAKDLDIANTIFASDEERLHAYEQHYGGYWRFSDIKDFCYLVNPYFPPRKLIEQMKYSYEQLLQQYPSGMETQRLLAEGMFGLDSKYLLVGNGAAELINILGRVITGRVITAIPTFNEYIRCFSCCEIVTINTSKSDFILKPMDMLDKAAAGDTVMIVNPDNPSGQLVERGELIEFLDACKKRNVRCIIDESFVDFADMDKRYSLLQEELLEKYPMLVVIKSISKSYGVPGLRLGIAATADHELLKIMKEAMPIWNINSFAEYFLQIYSLYADEYTAACDHIVKNRSIMLEQLKKLSYIKAYSSQANYIMCEVLPPFTAKELAECLLKKYQILIKDLSQKNGFEGKEYIRIAIRNENDNNILINALKNLS